MEAIEISLSLFFSFDRFKTLEREKVKVGLYFLLERTGLFEIDANF